MCFFHLLRHSNLQNFIFQLLMSKFLKYYFQNFSENHLGIYADNTRLFPLPQNNVVSRIKNLGQNSKGGWGNIVHFLGTCPIIFFHVRGSQS